MSSYYSKAFCCRHCDFFVNSIRKKRIDQKIPLCINLISHDITIHIIDFV